MNLFRVSTPVAGVLILLLAGCYTYRPLPSVAPAAGERVSAQLTDQGSRDLAGQIGPDILHVDGEVAAVDSGGFELVVRQVESFRGIQSDWNGEKVRLPKSAVAGIQQRQLSLGGTGLMSGVLAAAGYAIYRVLGGPGLFEGGTGQGAGGRR